MSYAKTPHFVRFCGAILLLVGVPGLLCSQSATYFAAEDEAFFGPYQDGWQTGDQGGSGFGPWKLVAPTYSQGEDRYAGFFLAEANKEADLSEAARQSKAFGIFANGIGFEETVAFRSIDEPLGEDDTFSFYLEFDGFGSKFDSDSPELSSVGLALREGSRAEGIEDMGRGRIWAIAAVEGLSTYQVLDADLRFNTRIFIDPQGIKVSVILGAQGTYDLRIETLGNGRVHEFPKRKFFPVKNPIQSFALFNRNGGVNNLYAGGFQIARPAIF